MVVVVVNILVAIISIHYWTLNKCVLEMQAVKQARDKYIFSHAPEIKLVSKRLYEFRIISFLGKKCFHKRNFSTT